MHATALCQFCLLAAFDAERGATLQSSVPCATGLDEAILAEQMIPDGLHISQQDWTVLYRPISALTGLPAIPQRPAHVLDKSRFGRAQDGTQIYILCASRTYKLTEAPRGAMHVAIAIGTMHPYLSMFKPAMILALDAYEHTHDRRVLRTLYDAFNQLDLSLLPRLSYSDKLCLRTQAPQLPASGVHAEKPAASLEKHLPVPFSSASMYTLPPACVMDASRASRTPGVQRTSWIPSKMRRHSTGFLRSKPRYTISEPRLLTKAWEMYEYTMNYAGVTIPMTVPLILFPEEVGAYSLTLLFSTFSRFSYVRGPMHPHLHTNGAYTLPLTVLFNALLSQKRVLFVAYHSPAQTVVDFVLAACAFTSGCGAVLRGFLEYTMPYATLVNVDQLQTMPWFIAGTKHPRMEEMGLWDVCCDCETGLVTVSTQIRWAAYHDESKRERVWRGGDERPNAHELIRVQEMLQATKAHASETFVRRCVQAYVRDFVQRATRYEHACYRDAPLAMLGVAFSSTSSKSIHTEAMRFEGWRGTRSYQLYVDDMHRLSHPA